MLMMEAKVQVVSGACKPSVQCVVQDQTKLTHRWDTRKVYLMSSIMLIMCGRGE